MIPIMAHATQYYQAFAYWIALHGVSYDTFIDSRDGQAYKVYRVEKPYKVETCKHGEVCLDSGIVFLFAENARYATDKSVCYDNDCSKGRYYPKSELSKVCPDGWDISTAGNAGIVEKTVIENDTIYAGSLRFDRDIQTRAFPADGEQITNKYSRLVDFPSGWYNSRAKKFEYTGKLGGLWVATETHDDFYPTFVNFRKVGLDELNGIIQSGMLKHSENMYPVKCHKALKPGHNSLDQSIFSHDWILPSP